MASPKLLDRMHGLLRARHYSIRTEGAYVQWAKRFILFHGKKHPSAMGAPQINEFLTHLAVERHVSASTQKSGTCGDSFPLSRCPRRGSPVAVGAGACAPEGTDTGRADAGRGA